MAFITPTNNVKLLTGVPINNDYENTLYFQNRTAQYNYFSSKVKYVNSHPLAWTNISYQRYMRNSIKLEVNAEAVFDCNYMMFQNTNFGDRWFYAFITNVEYVANQVTRIDYQIDAIQTWLMDCTINPSFIVRKHFASDSMWVSRTPEKLDTGEYVMDGFSTEQTFTESVYVMGVTKLPSAVATGRTLNAYFRRTNGSGCGIYYFCFPITEYGIMGVNDVIHTYVDALLRLDSSDIVMIFEAPKACFMPLNAQPVKVGTVLTGGLIQTESEMYDPDVIFYDSDMQRYTVTKSFPTAFNGYVPRNKKLLQYPYCFMYVVDGKGNNATYNYEDVDPTGETPPNSITFEITTCGSMDTAMMLTPRNYKGALRNFNESMVFKGFPMCSYGSDLYRAWYAQNGGIIGSAVRMLGGDSVNMFERGEIVAERERGYDPSQFSGPSEGYKVLGGTVDKGGKIEARYGLPYASEVNTGKFSNVAVNITNELANLAQHSKMPVQMVGNNNSDMPYFNGLHSFTFTNMRIRREYAERIDRYFDMFGYSYNMVDDVVYSSRAVWNYIQTIGLNIEANIPESFVKEIISIFENGIRFWKNPSAVGKYLTYADQNVAGA